MHVVGEYRDSSVSLFSNYMYMVIKTINKRYAHIYRFSIYFFELNCKQHFTNTPRHTVFDHYVVNIWDY